MSIQMVTALLRRLPADPFLTCIQGAPSGLIVDGEWWWGGAREATGGKRGREVYYVASSGARPKISLSLAAQQADSAAVLNPSRNEAW